jgi:hypothetical protein
MRREESTVSESTSSTGSGSATVVTRLNYIAPMAHRPRYYAHNSSRDVITRDRRTIRIEDARLRAEQPSLAREGFALFPHNSAVSDFSNQEELALIYPREIERLVLDLSGADHVAIFGRGVLRFGEHDLPDSSRFDVLRPARFIHSDISDFTLATLKEGWRPRESGRSVRRYAHYNVWRVLTPPPQDIPLAVCDARSVSTSDLVDADLITDTPGTLESSIVIVLLRYSPCHRWWYFPNMDRDEVLVFKSYDSDPGQPRQVPHSAFKNPACPPGIASRASIEMRATAFWLGD